MREQHILSAFDRDLEGIQAHVMRMGGLVEEALQKAAEALDERDTELAQAVRAADREIDNLEELLQQEIARLIALRAPTASDLRAVLSVLKISGNLERCGDYAKNIAKRTTILVEMPKVGAASNSIKRMMREVSTMLHDALDALARRDAELAERVRQRDHQVDQMYNSLFREFLTYMMEDPATITACMHFHFIAKNIERTGDHVTNIADQVIYLVTGSLPEEERPKVDVTAMTPLED